MQVQLISPDLRDPLTVTLPQTAPGEYSATLPNAPSAFLAIVTQSPTASAPSSTSPADTPALIARLNPPALPLPEWPANAIPGEVPPHSVTRLDLDSPTLWHPHLRGTRYDPRPYLLLAAATFLLAALHLRRAGR